MKFKSIELYSIAVRLMTPVSLDRIGSVGIEIRLLAGRVRKRRWFYDRTRSFYVFRSVETGEHYLYFLMVTGLHPRREGGWT